MSRIILTTPAGDQGRVIHDAGEFSGPLPPHSSEFRSIYEQLVGEGVVAEPYAVPEPPAPDVISDRQFFQALAMRGTITPREAIEAVKVGAIPSAMQAKIDAMPPDERFAATMLVAGATQFDRRHPMTTGFAALMGWPTDELDALWTYAAAL
jgi:hypothetical protein